MKRWLSHVALLGCLGLLLPAPVAAAEPAPAEAPSVEESLVEAYQTILYEHYNEIDQAKLLQAAIKGMIDSLGDPYSSAMSPAEYEAFVNGLNADYGGVGVLLEPGDGTLTILQVYKGAPAEAAGLQAGDRILAVDGQAITTENLEAAPRKIVGPAGTSVTLLIQRGDAKPVSYQIKRAQIDLPSVEGKELGNGLGYIQIHSMGEQTTAEFRQVRQALQQAKGIILDLRSNGGGLVLSAAEIADQFLAKGTIVSIEDGARNRYSLEADESDGPTDTVPLVVLVDEQTASAAEILTGALQRNGRALVVGTKTFGKGSMQQPFFMANGGVLKLTVDHWFLPDGTSLNQVGLQPDRVITTPALQLQAAKHLLAPKGPIETAIPTLQANGITYLPMRLALEALAVSVSWSPQDGTVTATYGAQQLVANPVTGLLQIGGAPVAGEAPIRLVEGKTYISASAFAQLTGLDLVARDGKFFLQTK